MKAKIFAVLNPNLTLYEFLLNLFIFLFQKDSYKKLFEKECLSQNKEFKYFYAALHARSLIYNFLLFLKKKHPHKNQVILPSYTCKVVVNAVLKAGLEPVFIDSKNQHFLIEPEEIKAVVNKKTLMVFIQHTFGFKQDYDSEFLKKQEIYILEDFAHAYRNFAPDPMADFMLMSFGQNKLFASSYGGVLLSKEKFIFLENLKTLNFLQVLLSHLRSSLIFIVMKTYHLGLGALIAKLLKINSMPLRQVSEFEKKGSLDDITYFDLSNSHSYLDFRAIKLYKLKHFTHRKQLFDVYRLNLPKKIQFEGVSPQGLFFPIKVSDPKALYNFMKSKGVYISLEWSGSNLVPVTNGLDYLKQNQNFKNSYDTSLHIVGLPVNLQTKTKDAFRVSNLIKEFYAR